MRVAAKGDACGKAPMRLTDYTDYGLRALIYAAIQPERLVTIQEIAESFRIPHSHLMKIVHALGKAGFLITVRGRKGGVKLAQPAAAIRIGDVVRALEPDFRIAECFSNDHDNCVIVTACSLRGTLQRALDAYLTVLDGCSVADLVTHGDALLGLVRTRTTGTPFAPGVEQQVGTNAEGHSPVHWMQPATPAAVS